MCHKKKHTLYQCYTIFYAAFGQNIGTVGAVCCWLIMNLFFNMKRMFTEGSAKLGNNHDRKII